MAQEKPSGYTALLPALLGAGISVFFIQSGFLGILFLVPLGFIGFGWGPRTLWQGTVFFFLGNCFLTLGTGLAFKVPFGTMAWDILFFTVMAGAFAWIILPPGEYGSRIPGAYRLAAGSSLCALISTGLFFRIINTPAFYENIMGQIEALAALYGSTGDEGMRNNIFESLNIEVVLEAMKNIMIRGGALVSSIIILFASRQISIFLVSLFGGKRRSNVFMNFYMDYRFIWIFGFSLLLLTMASLFRWIAFSIILWNIVTLGSMMYLAQGWGILKFFLTKPKVPSFMRFFLPVLVIFLLFSPGINMVVFGILLLLGIAENWVSLRTPVNGSPSTPGV
jgi:hypothetical protein